MLALACYKNQRASFGFTVEWFFQPSGNKIKNSYNLNRLSFMRRKKQFHVDFYIYHVKNMLKRNTWGTKPT
jgi:hypothetical protein